MPARAPARSDKKKTSSRFTGVNWDKSRGKWKAQLMHEGKIRYIGLFEDEVEAAKAYDAKARSLRGAATATNFNLDGSACGKMRSGAGRKRKRTHSARKWAGGSGSTGKREQAASALLWRKPAAGSSAAAAQQQQQQPKKKRKKKETPQVKTSRLWLKPAAAKQQPMKKRKKKKRRKKKSVAVNVVEMTHRGADV